MDLHYKQEITVGTLVLVGAALFIWGTTWLTGRSFSREPLVHISFSDAGTLKRGSPVKVSGVQLGAVKDIEYRGYGDVLIQISLDSRVQPKQDAAAELSSVGLVADAVINFNPGTAAEPLPPDAVVKGTVDKGFMELGEELSVKAKEVMGGVSEVANKELATQLRSTLQAVQRLANLLTNQQTGPTAELTRTLTDLRRIGNSLDSNFRELKLASSVARADTLMGNLSRISGDVRATALRFDTLLARVNRGEGTLGKLAVDTALFANAQRTLKSLQEFIDDLRKHPGKIGLTLRVF